MDEVKVGREPGKRRPWWVSASILVLGAPCVLVLLHQVIGYRMYGMPSSSMEPTLMGPAPAAGPRATGDRFRAEWVFAQMSGPQRGEIWSFRMPKEASPNEALGLKRVIGVPGDTVEVVGPRLLVDGKPALVLTGDSFPMPMGDRVEPKVLDDGRRAEITPAYGEPIKVIATPSPVVSYRATRVTVDGKAVLEDPNSQIIADSLDRHGADPLLKGSGYAVNGELRLLVLDGKRLTFDPGHVVVNGKRLAEPYLLEPMHYGMEPRKLADREYFLLGDNRNNSNDSHVWGPLSRERFIARAAYRYWPPDRIGGL